MKVNYFCADDAVPANELAAFTGEIKAKIAADGWDEPATGVKKTSDVHVVQYGALKDTLSRVVDIVLDVNKYNFGFDLYQPNEFTTLLYNEYNSERQGEYSWHNDAVLEECYDIKLTALVNCSTQPYTGGQFKLFVSGEWYIKEFDQPGSMIIFPSWIQHKVEPVTDGVRKSLALFFTGPTIR